MKNDPVSLYLQSLSTSGSRKSMRNVLTKFLREQMNSTNGDLETYPWSNVTVEDVRSYKDKLLNKGASPATINSVLAGVRGVIYQAMYGEGITADQRWNIALHKELKSIKTITPSPASADDGLECGDWQHLTSSLGHSLQELRDKGLFAALWGKPITAADIGNIRIDDQGAEHAEARLLYSVSSKAFFDGVKGRFGRISLNEEEATHIQRWVQAANLLPGDPLFIRVRRNTASTQEPLTKAGVGYTLMRVSKKLGNPRLTLRNLRRAKRS